MKDIGAPENRRSAERLSKARQALTTKIGVQQRKNSPTITSSMRMTRFLAMRFAVGVLLQTLLSLDFGLLKLGIKGSGRFLLEGWK